LIALTTKRGLLVVSEAPDRPLGLEEETKLLLLFSSWLAIGGAYAVAIVVSPNLVHTLAQLALLLQLQMGVVEQDLAKSEGGLYVVAARELEEKSGEGWAGPPRIELCGCGPPLIRISIHRDSLSRQIQSNPWEQISPF
jgi:hypothetical protein